MALNFAQIIALKQKGECGTYEEFSQLCDMAIAADELKQELQKVLDCRYQMNTTPGYRFSFRVSNETIAKWKKLVAL